jgi:hypothetical protein
MKAASYRPNAVRTDVTGSDEAAFDATSMISDNRGSLSIDVVNSSALPLTYAITLDGLTSAGDVRVTTLSAPTDAVNTSTDPLNVAPVTSALTPDPGGQTFTYVFPADSYTSLQLHGAAPAGGR